jgi:uncharacterized membrane protein YeaQ/YmgE (transglycosylase-associated protein family)
MDLVTLTMQLLSGALAGYGAGHYLRAADLGPIGSAIVGAVGGGIGGHILLGLLGLGGTVQVISALLVGAISGGIVTFLVGLLKSKVSP